MMVKQQQYKNLFNLKDKVAIITGGYGHLGLSMSKALASFGAKVFVMARTGLKQIDFDGSLIFIRCDVTDSKQVKKRINDILKNENTRQTINTCKRTYLCAKSKRTSFN